MQKYEYAFHRLVVTGVGLEDLESTVAKWLNRLGADGWFLLKLEGCKTADGGDQRIAMCCRERQPERTGLAEYLGERKKSVLAVRRSQEG